MLLPTMKSCLPHPGPRASLLAVLVLAGCSDDRLLEPSAVPSRAPVYAASALRCTGDVVAETFSCEEVASSVRGSISGAIAATDSLARRATRRAEPGMSDVVLLGGQGALLRARGQNIVADSVAGGERLTVWVQIRNLLTQPLGTSDGLTADPRGLVVFFPLAGGPNPVTVGAGTVTVSNSDTSGFWTSAGEVGFKYPGLVPPGGQTDLKRWTFSIIGGGTTFVSTVYVATQLMDETTTTITAPSPTPGFASLSASPGGGSTCGLRASTTILYCWGSDILGSLGSGSATGRTTPTNPVHMSSMSGLWLGTGHGCAITSAGIASCWGDNIQGQVSANSTSYFPLPRPVIGNLTFSTLGLGQSHSCGISAGKLWCWGLNSSGQIGDNVNVNTNRYAPTLVASALTFDSVTAGALHSCALTPAGAAYCWGSNSNAQLGDGTTSTRIAPVAVTMPTGVTFASIVAGDFHTCAISSSSSTPASQVYCWGRNANGQLGDGTLVQKTVPTQVSGTATFTRVVAGQSHSCGLSGTTVLCWGNNGFGQLGDSSFTQRTVPAAIAGAGAYGALASSQTVTCALNVSGAAFCWGENLFGTVGDPSRFNKNTPTAIPGGWTFSSIRVGGRTACGMSAGVARCWGDNRRGQFGDATLQTSTTPQAVISAIAFSSTIAAGVFHTCALNTTGNAYCWGSNGQRQVGDGSTAFFRIAPTAVAGIPALVKLSAGLDHTCGLTSGGAAYCWGQASEGQRGNGTTTTTASPTLVSGSTSFAAISAGSAHACALDSSGNAFCWGRNFSGQLGRGDTLQVLAPSAVTMPAGVQFASISAGVSYTCAISTGTSPTTWCWGANNSGQLGDGTTTGRLVPTMVAAAAGVPTFTALATGLSTTCAIGTDGKAFCWGSGSAGQLGNGIFGPNATTPVAVLMPTGVTFTSITAGQLFTCAVATTGAGYCWGSNSAAQFGNQSFFSASSPTMIGLQ